MTFASLMREAKNLFSVPRDNPELMRAQHAAFSKQVPLLYLILLTNTWSVALTHLHIAPDYLTIYFPMGFTAISVVRIVSWWRSVNRPATEQSAFRELRRTNRLAVILASGFAAWGLALYPYGDAYAQGHVAFYMGITVIGCIFCLMHLRSAALAVAVIVNTAFVVFFASSGHPTFVAIAVNVALVSVTMMVILWIYYRDFTALIDSRRALMAKQAETQALSDANFQLANLDSLTGLPNRRSFFADLNQRLAEASRSQDRFAVGILDLDGFKPVNDLHGHVVGDSLLVEVGRRLREVCGEEVFLSRLGGDEFGLIVGGRRTDEEIAAVGERLCAAMRTPFLLPEATVRVSCSIGFSVFPTSAGDVDALFEQADYALYRAKSGERGAAVLFSAAHDAEIRRHAAIERALRTADLDAELSVVFQPIVELGSRRPIAFEALARWTSADLGAVPPSAFIPVAERIGLIGGLTRILLRKALAEAVRWPEDVGVSFNLSAKDIAAADGTMRIAALILEAGVDPGRIDLEITETAVMQDYAQARIAVDALKALGVGISLDDFGTGYSSLTHLHTLPLDKIKIDRSFVAGIGDNPASYKIVRSVLSLSRDMGLACVVEGAETEQEIAVLQSLGATLVQGYYFSKPIPGDAVLGYLGGGHGSAVRRA